MDQFTKRWSLQGKTALVTGGTRGIGKAIVEELCFMGASVYLCGRSQKSIDECLNPLTELGYKVGGSTCDVTSTSEREELMKKAITFHDGKLDILVNNVGGIDGEAGKPIEDASVEFLHSLFSINVDHQLHLSQLAYPYLKASGDGNIVCMSSLAAEKVFVGLGLYGMCKASVSYLVKSLACEWAKDGIRVNGISPGYIVTNLDTEVYANPVVAHFEEVVPSGRRGHVHEIASVVAFFCLPTAGYLTGEVTVVDGGLSLQTPFRPEKAIVGEVYVRETASKQS